jgi:hypothetical protein
MPKVNGQSLQPIVAKRSTRRKPRFIKDQNVECVDVKLKNSLSFSDEDLVNTGEPVSYKAETN